MRARHLRLVLLWAVAVAGAVGRRRSRRSSGEREGAAAGVLSGGEERGTAAERGGGFQRREGRHAAQRAGGNFGFGGGTGAWRPESRCKSETAKNRG